MIGRRIISKLNNTQSIKDIASKFFAIKIPQSLANENYKTNTIVYSSQNTDVSNSKQQFQGLLVVQLNLELITNDYFQLQDLSLEVFKTFNKGVFNTGEGPVIDSCVLSSIGDETYNDNLEMYQVSHTYQIRVVNL
jgi:hypothetical protein